jgi:chromate transporter
MTGDGVESTPPTTLPQLAWLFGKLGFIAFGGPAAHIAMVEDEVMRRRRWMTHERLSTYLVQPI